MVDEGLVLDGVVLAGSERCVLAPLRDLELPSVLVLASFLLRDGETVGVGGGQGAHALDRGIDCGEVVAVGLSQTGLGRTGGGRRRLCSGTGLFVRMFIFW